MATKLSLRIHRVACIDETNGKYMEKIGNDEICLGGLALNNQGETIKIPPFSVYPHFDDGDVKAYNPPKIFYTFPLTASGNWPKGFGITFILIEKDAGGMEAAVAAIADASKNYLATHFKALVLSPPTIPSPKPPLPDLRRLLPTFKDDVFYPQFVSLSIPGPSFSWSGSLDSVEKTVNFRDHGGHYALTYDWLLHG